MIERIEGSTPVRRVSAAPMKGAAMTTTRAEIAGQSGLLATAKALAAQPAPVDLAWVGQLREAIRNGSYVIDPQSIARAMQETFVQESGSE
jgi:flagellar biosynthesis anti-sigma factor FlgM